ncbi:MAG: hypothetical protein JWN99_341 [Ilumatobacteraceae bacterium]|nr:hypothetical protein [Ilumatobacteraceae bacterium]
MKKTAVTTSLRSPSSTFISSSGGNSLTHSPLSRRSVLVGLIGAPLLAAVVAACGASDGDAAASDPTAAAGSTPPATDTPSTVAIQHPTGSTDVVIRYGYQGGFVAPGTLFVEQPSLVISGDGKAYRPGVTTMQFPGPMVMPMAVRSISETAVQTLLAAADKAGLLAPPPDYTAETNVADVPDTVVLIQANGQTYEHRAYALGFATDAAGNPLPESTPARAALQGFTSLLNDLETAVGADQLGAESVLAPAEYRLQAAPTAEADLAGIEPAPTVTDWPASTGLDLSTAAECARLTAAAAGTVFADADSNTCFRQGDTLYRISVAGVLPGDPAAC